MPEGWSPRHRCNILERRVLDEVRVTPSRPARGVARMDKRLRLVALHLACEYRLYQLQTDAELVVESVWINACGHECDECAGSAGRHTSASGD